MFTPGCLPILIGSLPLTDHEEALRLVLSATPDIPVWPQLPNYAREGMLRQFLDGFPGLIETDTGSWVDSDQDSFTDAMIGYYEEIMLVSNETPLPEASRFALPVESARGFHTLLAALARLQPPALTAKGQITGPITCGIGIKDQNGMPIFYNDNLRDMLVKHLSLKARWQIEQLRPFCRRVPPILFIDEPGMVSYGSSAFTGISRAMVDCAMAELIGAIKATGALAGIHICANGDWAPALQSAADIISFDAFSYFDNFILYREPLVSFLLRGGILAWGIVPTADPEAIRAASVTGLLNRWHKQFTAICALGIDPGNLFDQTLIAPACGTGSLGREAATTVLQLTSDLSTQIRSRRRSIIG